jgi:hypothetical protein
VPLLQIGEEEALHANDQGHEDDEVQHRADVEVEGLDLKIAAHNREDGHRDQHDDHLDDHEVPFSTADVVQSYASLQRVAQFHSYPRDFYQLINIFAPRYIIWIMSRGGAEVSTLVAGPAWPGGDRP